MAETALNFGPDWIRALATGSNSTPAPTSMPIPRYSLAQFRYGREEMLALIPKDIKTPKSLQQLPHLICDKFQIPAALTPQTEEEQHMWSRSVNSDVALRASGKSGTGYGMNRVGRGGSIDRGRGRGRGGYYQRGLMHEDSEDGPPSLSRPKVERSLSANEKDHRWDDRDRRYDRPISGQRGIDDNMKQDNNRGPNEYWRKFDKDEDGDWRSSGFRSSDKMGSRGSWRNNLDRERRDVNDRNTPNRNNRSGSGPPSRSGGHSWNKDNHGNLPEWSVEETSEPDTVGTFDASGAFLETKVTENTSYDDIYASDDADEGISDDTPEAKKENSKITPSEPPNSSNNKQTPNKQSAKSSSETISVEEKPVYDAPEASKNNSRNSPKSMVVENSTSNVISTVTEKQPIKKEPDVLPVKQPNVPTDSKKKTKVKLLSNVRNSENVMSISGVVEEDTFAHHQKATENMVAQWTEEIEQRVASQPDDVQASQRENENKWFYQDPQGELQGPFTSHEMLEWFSAGYFARTLMVRRGCDETFSQLGDLIKSSGQVPFMLGSSPPPMRAMPLKSPLSTPITQTIVPNPATAATSAQMPKQDEQFLALQQQLYQQQIMQQQLMLRQAQIQTLLSQLKQQDNFTSLTSQQQQQVLMQQFMAQQQMPRPNMKPENSALLDSMAPLPMPLLGLSIPPMLKSDLSLWQAPPSSAAWPIAMNEPPGSSIWDMNPPKQSLDDSELEKMKKLAEEQAQLRKAEEFRLDQEREMEEEKGEMRRKQEEARILQELKNIEEERKRMEEEKQQQEKKKLLEEQRREEELRVKQQEENRKEEQKILEELKKQEELKMQEEMKQQAEQKKLEELKKKEEQRKQQEELQKQKELQKQEERRKKEDIQKKIQLENEKMLEVERQKEALRLKELEREERLQREREEAEMRRIAELKKSQGPAWGIQNQQIDSEMSLADIQRLQEEKEKKEREEKMRQQLLQQQAVKQVQQSKNSLSWAKRTNDSQSNVKSLIEIQHEEAERLSQLNRMQKPLPPPPAVNSNVGVWGNSSHLSKITTPPPSWNSNNVTTTTGFWDDALHSTQLRKQPPKSSTDSAFPALSIPSQPAIVNSNKGKNIRAKKEEDAVARLFVSHHKPTDEFTKWCTEAISAMPSSVDVPTFVAFLKDIESPYEVYDYVKSYFGEGKEPREFSKLFLEKRSKFRNQTKQPPAEDNTLWGPAPAITPPVNKTIAPVSTDCDGNSSTRAKSKKRKGKMQKLDNSMLGFIVQSNPDRVNVGEIDHIENI